ncbi:MAG: GntR family transcriptional regulator [Spirochaetales bacterium]|uniref:GntR family transcriptional regulator n=1 Tax=Candidatus Thalassospirochaeta sargassi TaxID=3119039 RepID=A0AAJ1MKK1_9SPIO|nr:GntR family transcriptional regulator [Spirochaetales bacterium]
MKKTPMYMKVYRLVVKRIESNIYPVDSLLPPEPELQEEFQISRTTVRKAMELLAHDGYVTIKQGLGTRVNDRKAMSQLLNYVSSFSETLKRRGCVVTIGEAFFSRVEADAERADILEIKPGSELYYLRRVIQSDGRPVAIAENYLIPRFVPGMADDYQSITSLYQYLEKKWGITIESAFDRITAKAAEKDEAETLGLLQGAPLLVDRRITYTMGTAFEAVTLTIDAKSYEFGISTKGRLS